MVLQKIRNSKIVKVISVITVINLFAGVINPTKLYALTSGPSTPEIQSFEPINTNQMVDLFSGDFTYNIPLFNLPGPDGGYPFNLAYHAGIGMDQEASWVGLGWNINPGALNRNVRNLPDEFDGDQITVKKDMKPNVTVGTSIDINWEIWGANYKKGSGGTHGDGSISLSQGIYYNNYKGYGSSVGFGISYDKNQDSKGLLAGLSFDFDSQQGTSVNANIGYGNQQKKKNGSYSLGLGYNSKSGLSNISLNCKNKFGHKDYTIKNSPTGVKLTGSESSALTFSSNSFSPSIQLESRGLNLALRVSLGSDIVGFYGYLGFGGSYSHEWIKDRCEDVLIPAYGYMNIPNDNTDGILDMEYEKQGLIHEKSPNIAMPSLSCDAYSVVGQGMGGMFRAYHSGIGITNPRNMTTKSFGGNIGVELGFGGPIHTGINIGFNMNLSKSGKWKKRNEFAESNTTGFSSSYFRMYGEHVAEDMSGEYDSFVSDNKPVSIDLEETTMSWISGAVKALNHFSESSNSGSAMTKYLRQNSKPANTNILAVYNRDLIEDPFASTSNYSIEEYTIDYYDAVASYIYAKDNTLKKYERKDQPSHHYAGYTMLNSSGMRYVYALPAINHVKKDVVFTINGQTINEEQAIAPFPGNTVSNNKIQYDFENTDMYFSETNIPEHAYSYLLTSVLGNDYVDIDGTPGPSDGDIGYWVKFNYVKTSSSYKWKAPYDGISVIQGNRSSAVDDKGAYLYGEKDLYYLATAETKTHIAQFIISQRDDSRGANKEFHNMNVKPNSNASFSYKLDKIKLFSKDELYDNNNIVNSNAVPIQIFHFEYGDANGEYTLCKNVNNNANTSNDNGKLTLKRFYITYKDNNRGLLSPYSFDYSSVNPDYNPNAVDRWGGYKQIPNGIFNSYDEYYNVENPYVDQMEQRTVIDQNASAWNLNKITLPSGGVINVDYESDDYAYVQDKVAMQMTEIKSLAMLGTNAVYNAIDNSNTKIYFELEHPVPSTASSAEQEIEAEKYISPGDDLYYKVLVDLDKDGNGFNEYIKGYATVKSVELFKIPLTAPNFTYGCIELEDGIDGNDTYHPFSMAAWQHIRLNIPTLLGTKPNSDMSKKRSNSEKVSMIRSLLKMFDDIGIIFKGYYKYMDQNDYAGEIVLDKSFIRLHTPDLVKYGGGHRVKSIIFNDNWNTATSENNSEYGQIYDYTMKDDKYGTISSGVAIYEPLNGGDEIPLRKPVNYIEEIRWHVNNDYYIEEPINERLFPAPSVGYQQVTVMSLATSNAKNGDINTSSTTGKIVSEFYTAKDFPIIVDQTELNDVGKRVFNLFIPIPFIGSIYEKKVTVSQGYSIELNDMHGKLKRKSSYGQDKDGNFLDEEGHEVSSVEYFYGKDDYNKERSTYRLNNKVLVIIDDNTLSASDLVPKEMDMATEVEFFADMYQSSSFSMSAGLDFGAEITPAFPIPIPWPSYSHLHKKLRVAATNKVIHKSGIIKKIVTYDGQTRRTVENIYYDQYTGKSLLTETTNDFGSHVFSYNIPAYREYEGMGQAYKNLHQEGSLDILSESISGNNYTLELSSSCFNTQKDKLFKGDQLVVYLDNSANNDAIAKITYLGINDIANRKMLFYGKTGLVLKTANILHYKIVRSGRRNLLDATAFSVVSLKDPTKGREESNTFYEKVYPGEEPILLPLRNIVIDDVIIVEAISFSDAWARDLSHNSSSINANPFAIGELGIWKKSESYAYVADRNQSSSLEIDIDGTMDNVPLFQWHNLVFLEMNQNQTEGWKFVDRLTKVNDNGDEIENIDAAGINSSALYDKNHLAVAIAANAANSEIGFESFENFATNLAIDITSSIVYGNIDIYNIPYSASDMLYDTYDAYGAQGTINTINLSRPVRGTPLEVHVSALLYDNMIYPATISDKSESIKETFSNVTLDPSKKVINLPSPIRFSSGNIAKDWRGTIAVKRSAVAGSGNSTAVFVSNTHSHSGKQSMCFNGTTSSVKFVQNHMQFIGGKDYILSVWVSRDFSLPSVAKPFLRVSDFMVKINSISNSGTSTIVSAVDADYIGQPIEGWQQLMIKFTAPTNSDAIELEFTPGSTDKFYIDDLRILPLNAEMQSYVYDKIDGKLHAVLDNNNYATFYFYNEDGSLFLIKKETERGIVTIQESRAHSSITN